MFGLKSLTFRVFFPIFIIVSAVSFIFISFYLEKSDELYERLESKRQVSEIHLLRQVLHLDEKNPEAFNVLEGFRTPLGKGVFVTKLNGKLLYPKDNHLDKEIVKETLVYMNQTSNYHDSFNYNDMVVSYSYIPQQEAVLAMFSKPDYSYLSFLNESRTATVLTIGITLGGLLVAVFLALWLSVIRPVKVFSKRMSSIIIKGDFTDYTDVSSFASDEIKSLEKSFKITFDLIRLRDAELKKYTNELEEEVKKRTFELLKVKESLLEKEKLAAIGQFVSFIVHELRNPLSSIKLGIVKLQSLENLDEKNTRRLELMDKETNRLTEMLEGILGYARFTESNVEKMQITNFWEEYKRIILAVADKDVKIDFNDACKKSFLADKNKFIQVILNLIKNASEAVADFSELDKKISVDCNENNENITISIKNKGDLPKDVLERVFEPFFTTKGSGTGLGLAISKKLMIEMNGSLDISNKDGFVVVDLKLPLN